MPAETTIQNQSGIPKSIDSHVYLKTNLAFYVPSHSLCSNNTPNINTYWEFKNSVCLTLSSSRQTTFFTRSKENKLIKKILRQWVNIQWKKKHLLNIWSAICSTDTKQSREFDSLLFVIAMPFVCNVTQHMKSCHFLRLFIATDFSSMFDKNEFFIGWPSDLIVSIKIVNLCIQCTDLKYQIWNNHSQLEVHVVR